MAYRGHFLTCWYIENLLQKYESAGRVIEQLVHIQCLMSTCKMSEAKKTMIFIIYHDGAIE